MKLTRPLRFAAPYLAATLGVFALAWIVNAGPAATKELKAGGGKSWWRGNTHTHTLWSDGDAAPEMAVAWYKEHGYNFLVLSDHNILSRGEAWRPIGEKERVTPERLEDIRRKFGPDWAETRKNGEREEMRLKTLDVLQKQFDEAGKFMMIEGEEISASLPQIHINAINTRELILPMNGKTISDAIQATFDAVDEQSRRLGIPMFAHIDHPNWDQGVTAEVLIRAGGEKFFEVFNGHSGVRNWGSEKRHMVPTDRLWDIILAMRLSENKERPMFGVATDDTHHYHEFGVKFCNAGRGWIMVLAEELTDGAIIEAVKRGDFYATTGVELESITMAPKEYRVAIKAEPGVKYKTQFIGTKKKFDRESTPVLDAEGKPMQHVSRQYSPEIGVVLAETAENPAVYPVTGDELYVRAKIISDMPHANPFAEGDPLMAWTQPLVVE